MSIHCISSKLSLCQLSGTYSDSMPQMLIFFPLTFLLMGGFLSPPCVAKGVKKYLPPLHSYVKVRILEYLEKCYCPVNLRRVPRPGRTRRPAPALPSPASTIARNWPLCHFWHDLRRRQGDYMRFGFRRFTGHFPVRLAHLLRLADAWEAPAGLPAL